MRARLTWTSVAAVALLTACGTRDGVSDPIEGISLAHQKTISRAQFGFRWPLSPGTGTLACAADGVILFRTGGVSYIVSGSRPGAAEITPLRVAQPSPLPSHPAKRLTQNVRMEAFASLERCASSDQTDACSRGVQERFGLSTEEARLIDAEGQERRWPPLDRDLMSLDPLLSAGRALCNR
jgi:hypothetical protein